ncbi:MAG: DNA-directed RNA polymerase subunit beta' [Lactobacillales bacterium]|jgi:DNA-directed RNA polymerase subunit beta'|nr:DNA-directed RNA polymerase subunit beta' [Lactobacillales bacterium]
MSIDINKFKSMQIGLASPEKIRSWSFGEVKKPETINYRTSKPEKDGLFCEVIFGPTKDWECSCGKYKRILYKGIVCDRCGVEVTRSKVRRERLGHIDLAVPVSHIWYFKGIPSRMGLVLDMSPKALEEIIYFAKFVVTDPGNTEVTGLVKKQLLTEFEYRELKDVLYDRVEAGEISPKEARFEASIGAEAIQELLQAVDLEAEKAELTEKLIDETGQKRVRMIKRLDIIDSFINSDNKPEWMVLEVLPVIPPELRPMVQLEGGRFATSDLNDLYRRVITRNNRLKSLMDKDSPTVIIQNEKRMLQDAVDALVDNGRRGRPATGPGNRPLKSLSQMLKGKQGRFRQNLLGKRVDYSGRSVIVVGPFLKMHQCGMPKEMAIELFKPFVLHELLELGFAENIKIAKRMIENRDKQVWDVLQEVIREHPVLLNRAPTLHRLGIQAFEPVLVEGKAIRLHPLVCEAFNADFDGDQMAVHVPLSEEAQAEARMLMLAAHNILNPKDGKPVVTPSQDMVLGNYYLTMEKAGVHGEGMLISSLNEAIMAWHSGAAHLHTRVAVSAKALKKPFASNPAKQKELEGKILITTIGKLIFNSNIPEEFYYLNEPTDKNLEVGTPENYFVEPGTDLLAHLEAAKLVEPFKKKYLGKIISAVFASGKEVTFPITNIIVKGEDETDEDVIEQVSYTKKRIKSKFSDAKIVFESNPIEDGFELVAQVTKVVTNVKETSEMLDRLKDLGYQFSTISGITVGIADIPNIDAQLPRPYKLGDWLGGETIELGAKSRILELGYEKEALIQKRFARGMITDEERHAAVIKLWGDVKDELVKVLQETFEDSNPIYMMMDSGARGNISNFAQLAAMRGLMAAPNGGIIELPITSNFREGLSVLEMFMSTHGARKGMTDTALKTADSGYLTRRLVDVAQEIIIREDDCGTDKGIKVTSFFNENDGTEIEPLRDRIVGRYLARTLVHEGEVLAERNEFITEDLATKIVNLGIEELEIRSAFTCNSKHGICKHCYGKNLATASSVEVGEAVGTIAAQSIGEPGTQLTMRTFHTGGVAGDDITQGLPRVQEIFEARNPKGKATISEVDGEVISIGEPTENERTFRVIIKGDIEEREYKLGSNVKLKVKEGGRVFRGQPITQGSIAPKELLRVTDALTVKNYLLKEVQKVYRMQGVEIGDKHIEVISGQMINKLKIIDAGTTTSLPGTLVDHDDFMALNEPLLLKGFDLYKQGDFAASHEIIPATSMPECLGITKASLATNSFLSAASFQETTRVLTDAAIRGKRDELLGLKENVIIGKIIPAGAGMEIYRDIETFVEKDSIDEVLGGKK